MYVEYALTFSSFYAHLPIGCLVVHAWSWQYTRLFHTIMTTAFAAKAPSYAKIMEMDKRVRDFPVPTSLRIQCGEVEMPPPSTALIMQRMFGTLLKETSEWMFCPRHAQYSRVCAQPS